MKQKKEPPKTAKDFELTALYASKEYLIDNEEVEKKLIGVMLQYSDIHADFFARVSSAMFAYEFPRMVFTAAEALYHQGKNIDIFTVWEEIKRGGAEDDHNLIFFNMGQLGAGMTEHYYLNDNILILQSYYTRRQGYLLLGNMIQKMQTLTEDAADVLTETIQLCTGLLAATGATEQLKEMPQVMETVFDALALRMEQGAQGVTGIDMGIPTMNELLMGWQPGSVYHSGTHGIGKNRIHAALRPPGGTAGKTCTYHQSGNVRPASGEQADGTGYGHTGRGLGERKHHPRTTGASRSRTRGPGENRHAHT